jgi:phosphatidylserine/phosphatidylglycerophosphate/cardiolipin synthase-like enzyme
VEQAIVDRIDGAQQEISLMMYLLTMTSIVDALIAAHQRGVSVRVLLHDEKSSNNDTITRLEAEGVPWRAAPGRFEHAHSKVMILDRAEALVMSGNFNSYTMSSERNYGVFLKDAEDLADLRAIFERDWDDATDPDLSCTRLLVSPINGKERVLELIQGAQETLDLAVMYATETQVVAAIKARAAAGVKTRVLLADPAWIDSNTQTASSLEAAQIPVKFLKSIELHAKLVIADGQALVGSHNLSYTSLSKNREVGLIVTNKAVNEAVTKQFEADWLLGVAP